MSRVLGLLSIVVILGTLLLMTQHYASAHQRFEALNHWQIDVDQKLRICLDAPDVEKCLLMMRIYI